MNKYECTVCEYEYDPDHGDPSYDQDTGNPEGGVEEGTSFENLPDDWVCPRCGAGKDMFEEL